MSNYYQDGESDAGEKLILPEVLPDDVQQERALRDFQGLSSSRKITALKLQSRGDGASLYGVQFSPQLSEASPPWGHEVFPSPDVIEKLLKWSLEQASDVQKQIWRFLERPQERYNHTFRFLKQKHLLRTADSRRKKTTQSLNTILLAGLPATQEELVNLVVSVQPTKRPQATVRQFIRRNIKRGRIEYDADHSKLLFVDQGVSDGSRKR